VCVHQAAPGACCTLLVQVIKADLAAAEQGLRSRFLASRSIEPRLGSGGHVPSLVARGGMPAKR